MGFSSQEYWAVPAVTFSRDLPETGIKPAFPALQADSLPLSHLGKPKYMDKILFKTEMPEPINELKAIRVGSFHKRQRGKIKDESFKKRKTII